MIMFCFLALIGCTNHDATVSTLESSGFTEIQTGKHDFFSCGQDDFYATKFTATNPIGKKVKGTVCCGMIVKSCTVRF